MISADVVARAWAVLTHSVFMPDDTTSAPRLGWEAAKAFLTLAISQNKPVMLHGLRGSGKSALVKELTNELNAHLVDIRLSYYAAVDLRGVPQFGVSNGPVEWLPPASLPFEACRDRFPSDRLIILFLDELFQASEDTQKAAFQLVLDRAIGEHKLLPNVRIVAASNFVSENAGASLQLDPLKNRFQHIVLLSPPEAWAAWAREKWQGNRLVALVADFIESAPDQFNLQSEVGDRLAFPTPRTWEMVCETFAAIPPTVTPSEQMLTLLASPAIGFEAATLLAAFISKRFTAFDIEGILASPHTYHLPASVQDAEILKAAFKAAYFSGRFAEDSSVEALSIYFRRIVDAAPELFAPISDIYASELASSDAVASFQLDYLMIELDNMMVAALNAVTNS